MYPFNVLCMYFVQCIKNGILNAFTIKSKLNVIAHSLQKIEKFQPNAVFCNAVGALVLCYLLHVVTANVSNDVTISFLLP